MKSSTLTKFITENSPKKGTLVEFRFKKGSVEVGVQCHEFFISEKFDLEDSQNPNEIDGAIFVKSEDMPSKIKGDIVVFKEDEKGFFINEEMIPVDKKIPNRQRHAPIVINMEDPSLLHWFAANSTPPSKDKEPLAPYIYAGISNSGLRIGIITKIMFAKYEFSMPQLKEWKSSIPPLGEDGEVAFMIQSSAIKKCPKNLPIEIHVTSNGGSTTLKSGCITLKTEKIKDPLPLYVAEKSFFSKESNLKITFDEPANNTEPSRMEKIVAWHQQVQAKQCDILVGNKGMWIAPLGYLKNPDALEDQAIKEKACQIDTMSFLAGGSLVASLTANLVNAIQVMGMKSVEIAFPTKQGEVLTLVAIDKFAAVATHAKLLEIPIAEVAEIPALIDETPIAVEQGTETLVEVPTTTGEAIQQAIAEDKVPKEMKEQVNEAIEEAEAMAIDNLDTLKEIKKKAKGKKSKETPPSDFADGAQEVGNAIVPTQSAELAKAIDVIAETAIVEAIDPDSNVINLDPKTKKKAKAVKEAVKQTKAELETEIQSESVDLNRIIALTLRLETLGGRFVEITFSLHTKWYPTLTITEAVKAEARKQYPHLAA